MNLNDACWARSRVKKDTCHLFFANDAAGSDNFDGSACGLSSLTACETPERYVDAQAKRKAPADACPSCKGIWNSWNTVGAIAVSSPHSKKPKQERTRTPKQQSDAAYDALCSAHAKDDATAVEQAQRLLAELK